MIYCTFIDFFYVMLQFLVLPLFGEELSDINKIPSVIDEIYSNINKVPESAWFLLYCCFLYYVIIFSTSDT